MTTVDDLRDIVGLFPTGRLLEVRIERPEGTRYTLVYSNLELNAPIEKATGKLVITDQLAKEDRRRLRKSLSSKLSLSDLETVCFDMAIEREQLSATTKERLVRELIVLCERTGRINELVNYLRTEYPHVLRS